MGNVMGRVGNGYKLNLVVPIVTIQRKVIVMNSNRDLPKVFRRLLVYLLSVAQQWLFNLL